MRLHSLKPVLLDLFGIVQQQLIRVRNIHDSSQAQTTLEIAEFNKKQGEGVLFRCLQCMECKRMFYEEEDDERSADEEGKEKKVKKMKKNYHNVDWNAENIKVFTCGHTFHDRCVTNHYEFSGVRRDCVSTATF